MKRDTSIDFIKGMLIWGVVYGHVISVLLMGRTHEMVWLHTFLRTFDMPFFMVLSGHFLRKSLCHNGCLRVMMNRCTMILVPIVVWTLIRGQTNIFGEMYYFLWAVLVGSAICVIAYGVGNVVPFPGSYIVEGSILGGAVVYSHLCEVPWNFFYLFPFFVAGYYASHLPKLYRGWLEVVLLFSLITGLCFWRVQYTPWNLTGVAWQKDAVVIVLYVYRFCLGLLGVHVMWKVYAGLRECLGEENSIVTLITTAGGKTLQIYILHILILSAVRRIISVIPLPPILFASTSIIGYVIAPLISILIIAALLPAIELSKNFVLMKYSLGFKVKQVQG